MTRNLRNRVEVVFPVYDEEIKKQVLDFVDIQFMPAGKTQLLSEDLDQVDWPGGIKQNCAQESFHDFLKQQTG